MDNLDYRNRDKELQIYQGSLDNYEESGNTQNDYGNTSDLNSNYENSPDELGNTSEEGYPKSYYSQTRRRTPVKAEKYAITLILTVFFVFFLILLSSGIISYSSISSSKASQPPPKSAHPFMSLDKISLPMLEGKFESELQTADLVAINRAIFVSKQRLNDLYDFTDGWLRKKEEASKNNDSNKYHEYNLGLDFNQHQISLLEKQLKMLEQKKIELEALDKK